MTIRHLTVFVAVAEQGSMTNIFIFPSQRSARPSGNWKTITMVFSLNASEKNFISQTVENCFFHMPGK